MDELTEHLLPGETVIWHGAPDFSAAAPGEPQLKWHATHAAWTLGLLAVLAGSVVLGFSMPAGSFLRGLCYPAVIISAIGFCLAIGLWSNGRKPAPRPPEEQYALTDRRLLIFSNGEHKSYFGRPFDCIESVPNGSVRNLKLWMSESEFTAHVLLALEDADRVEKLLLDRFVERTEVQ